MINDAAEPMYWVSANAGSAAHMRGGRYYKVHITRPGVPDRLGCPERLEGMVPVGRETSVDGAVCKRCAKLWPRHA